jgi:hypothetical protein
MLKISDYAVFDLEERVINFDECMKASKSNTDPEKFTIFKTLSLKLDEWLNV